MADQTGSDITLPLTPAKIAHGVEHIVEQAFPRPRQELCIPVGEMERKLTAFVGEVVQAAYDDAAGIARDARERLARHLFLTEWPDSRSAQRAWDEKRITRDPYIARAQKLVAVITGQETQRG